MCALSSWQRMQQCTVCATEKHLVHIPPCSIYMFTWPIHFNWYVSVFLSWKRNAKQTALFVYTYTVNEKKRIKRRTEISGQLILNCVFLCSLSSVLYVCGDDASGVGVDCRWCVIHFKLLSAPYQQFFFHLIIISISSLFSVSFWTSSLSYAFVARGVWMYLCVYAVCV